MQLFFLLEEDWMQIMCLVAESYWLKSLSITIFFYETFVV